MPSLYGHQRIYAYISQISQCLLVNSQSLTTFFNYLSYLLCIHSLL